MVIGCFLLAELLNSVCSYTTESSQISILGVARELEAPRPKDNVRHPNV